MTAAVSNAVCGRHYMRFRRHGSYNDPPNHADRLTAKSAPGPGDCILYTGALDKDGYGKFLTGRAHRIAWELLYGPLPKGAVLDHTCHNAAVARGACQGGPCFHRRCINVEHLALSTSRANSYAGDTAARRNRVKTHCPLGHPYSGENLVIGKKGGRGCRICQRAAVHRSREKRLGRALAPHWKLTAEQVAEIRAIPGFSRGGNPAESGAITLQEMADRYGVSRAHVQNIRKGRSWK